MKTIRLYFYYILICFTAGACESTRNFAERNLLFVEVESYAACKAILLTAVNSKDREEIKAYLFAVASAGYTVTGGQPATPEQYEAALKLVTPKGKEWASLVKELESIWIDWFPSIKGDPALALKVVSRVNAGIMRATRPAANAQPHD